MLRVDGLVKRYGDTLALKGVTFAVEPGAIYGFVGPNGAGKTTTLKVVATLLQPDAGRVFIGDVDVLRSPHAARARLGYMPDFFGVYDNLKVDEYMQFYADCYGVPVTGRERLIGSLLELVNLTDKREAYVDGLSRGMKQRLCLARCLVHDPDLLILDEPASGLDPRARVEMREILQELRRRGKTILISSHILAELAEMCTHIGIISGGEMVLSGPVDQVQREAGARVIEVRLAGGPKPGPDGVGVDPETLAVMQGAPGVRSVTAAEGTLRVALDGDDEAAAALLAHLVRSGLPVVHFAEAKSNLEDIFMATTGGEAR